MCLYVKTTFKTRQEARDFQPLVAKKNIEVWKILMNEGKSPYRHFKWEPGFHYYQDNGKLPKNINGCWNIQIHAGLHAFVDEVTARKRRREMFYYHNKHIVKMTIPKGAKYFLGTNGDIVSTEMIYPKK